MIALTAEEFALVREGRRIDAIRALRVRLGLGLKEAFDATAPENPAPAVSFSFNDDANELLSDFHGPIGWRGSCAADSVPEFLT